MICIEQFWNEKHVKNVSEWPAGNAVLLAFTRFGLKVLAGVGQSQVCVHRAGSSEITSRKWSGEDGMTCHES